MSSFDSLGLTSAFRPRSIIRLLLPPRSSILLEAYAYPGTLAALDPLQINTVGIAMDSEGLVPSAMDDVLSAWDETARGTKRPRVVLIVPTGQNPTGATMGTQRRRDLYEVARKWNLVSRSLRRAATSSGS